MLTLSIFTGLRHRRPASGSSVRELKGVSARDRTRDEAHRSAQVLALRALADQLQREEHTPFAAFVWTRVLKSPDHAMLRSIEVSTRGMVHAHVLYYGHRKGIDEIRTAYMLRAGDSPQVRIEYVKNPKTAVREVAKYAVKGPSPKRKNRLTKIKNEYMDPRLAARVEIAVAGKRLVEF